MSWEQTLDGDIALARFCNPPMNYYTDALVGDLEDCIDSWSSPDVAAVVLTSGVSGRFITHFSVEDILRNQTAPEGPIDAPRRGRRVHAALRRLNELPKPVISAINGDAMGFGLELALATDFRLVQRGDFRLGFPEVRLGVIPGGSGTTRLTKLLGTARALELIACARLLTPDEALELGIVHEVVDDAVEGALELAGRLAAMPRTALAMAKKVVYQGSELPLDVALGFELEGSYRAKQASDAAAPMREYLALPDEDRRNWLDADRAAGRARP